MHAHMDDSGEANELDEALAFMLRKSREGGLDDDITQQTFTEADATSSTAMNPTDIVIPEGDPVNFALGVDQCGGREDLFVSLLEKFALGCGNTMAKILEAHEQKNIVVLRRESHSLKGASSYVAALRLSKSAFRVQIACERLQEIESASGNIDALVETLDESVARVKKEHKLLWGYLRRNFGFSGQLRTMSNTGLPAPSEGAHDRPTGPCTLM